MTSVRCARDGAVRLPDRKIPRREDSINKRRRKLARATRYYDRHGWPCDFGEHQDAKFSAVQCLGCGL